MAYKTITIDEKAYGLLSGLKQPGDSFSKVIHRNVRQPCANAGELIDEIWASPAPELNEQALAALTKGRGRRSQRK